MKNILISIKENLGKFWDWLVWSSADPDKVALTVKGVLVGAIPTILAIVSSVCGFGLICVGVDQEGLNQGIESIGALLEGALYIVSGVMFAYGLVRKFTTPSNQG